MLQSRAIPEASFTTNALVVSSRHYQLRYLVVILPLCLASLQLLTMKARIDRAVTCIAISPETTGAVHSITWAARTEIVSTSLLLIESYANESSQICPFLAVRLQFESVHHQNRSLSSHSYSHDFFVFLGLLFVKLRRVCVFWVEMHAARLLQTTCCHWNRHGGSVHYITIGDSRLPIAAGLTRSPLYSIGDAASRRGLSRVGYFIPLNGRRPLNGHPPSNY